MSAKTPKHSRSAIDRSGPIILASKHRNAHLAEEFLRDILGVFPLFWLWPSVGVEGTTGD
jgi:hypothetical protein